MRWPEASRLIDRIRRERPELIVDHQLSAGTKEHYCLRLYCILKEGRKLIRESLDTIYGSCGWKRYVERHPRPRCSPNQSYPTDALGREVDHHCFPVQAEPPRLPKSAPRRCWSGSSP